MSVGRIGREKGAQHEKAVEDLFKGVGWGYYTSPSLDYGNKTDGVAICPEGEKFPVQASWGGKSKKETGALSGRGISVVTNRDLDTIDTVSARFCNKCSLFEVCLKRLLLD